MYSISSQINGVEVAESATSSSSACKPEDVADLAHLQVVRRIWRVRSC